MNYCQRYSVLLIVICRSLCWCYLLQQLCTRSAYSHAQHVLLLVRYRVICTLYLPVYTLQPWCVTVLGYGTGEHAPGLKCSDGSKVSQYFIIMIRSYITFMRAVYCAFTYSSSRIVAYSNQWHCCLLLLQSMNDQLIECTLASSVEGMSATVRCAHKMCKLQYSSPVTYTALTLHPCVLQQTNKPGVLNWTPCYTSACSSS
jgi:hypothetical protein